MCVTVLVDLSEVLASVTIDIAPLGFELKRIKYVVRCLSIVSKVVDYVLWWPMSRVGWRAICWICK